MADEIDSGSPAVESVVTETPNPTPSIESNPVDAASPSPNKEPAIDRVSLEARVAESLKTFREIDEPTETEPEANAPDETSEETDSSESDSEPKAEEVGEPTEETEQQPVAKKQTGPTLPGHLVRSLKAYGWSDEDIQSSYQTSGEKFLLTAQNIHNSRNKETSQWAEAGRAARANQPAPEARPTDSPHIDTKTGGFKLLDVAEMGEEYGNPELIERIVGPINAALTRINSVLPDLSVGIQTVQKSRTDQLAQQIDGFFGGPELKTFAEAYGKDTASLTEPQIEARNKVLEMADALVAGAKQQGRKLAVNDALMMAHDHVSSGLKAQTIRKQIQTSVQKRSAGITIRPTAAGKGSNSSGPANSKSELESRVKSRLAAVFGT